MPRPDMTEMIVSQGVVVSKSTIGRGMIWTILRREEDGEIGKEPFKTGHSATMEKFVQDVVEALEERDAPFREDAA